MQFLSLPGARSPLILFLSLTLAASSGACSSSDDSDEADGDTPSATLTQPIVASTLEADLAAAGVDVENPPDWETLSQIWESKLPEGVEAFTEAATPVMTLFMKSLGIADCKGCHSEGYYQVPAAKKNLVIGMWDQWVHELRLKDGGLLFCDSCHQGQEAFLRRDDPALSTWMTDNLVNKVARADGSAQSCASCHGEPFEGAFLTGWAAGD
jgi:Cytochrome c7 and related cytochrome c